MTGISSPITDAWLALDPSIRAQAEKIAGANRQMSWPETLLVIATAIVEERERAWLPIETAPKDGTTILLYCPKGDGNPGSTYRVTVGDWCEDYGGTTEYRDLEGRWIGQDDNEGFIGWLSWDGGFSEDTMMPSHWQPLPSPPAPLPSYQEKEADE